MQYLLRDVKQKIQGPYKDGSKDSAAIPGKTLQLYIDAKLQKLAEDMLANKLGSAIAIDPSTGGILAFASGSSFNPDLLTGTDKSKNLGNMLVDATKPWFNRAIKANYPPGSTFKPITALVALNEGVITPSFGMGCGEAIIVAVDESVARIPEEGMLRVLCWLLPIPAIHTSVIFFDWPLMVPRMPIPILGCNVGIII